MPHLNVQLPFFVYGTLLPGEANYYLWRDAITGYQPALISGARLYDLGHFPMLVEASDGEVRGMVVRVRPSSYPAALSLLDQLEGVNLPPLRQPGYRRVRRIVRPMGESPAVAWVYLGSAAFVVGREPIAGDWKSYRRRCVRSV